MREIVKYCRWVALSLSLVVIWRSNMLAQNDSGLSAFSAVETHTIDAINLQNLNVMLTVPVFSKAGLIPFTHSLFGSSGCSAQQNGQIVCGVNPANDHYGYTQATVFSDEPPSLLGYTLTYQTSTAETCPNRQHTYKLTNWVITEPNGTQHFLKGANDWTDSLGCYQASFTDSPADNSGLTGVALYLGGSVYNSGGVTGGAGTVQDPNGNSITHYAGQNYYTDTLGLVALTATPENGGTGQAAVYSWSDVNGGSPQVSETLKSTTLQSVPGCSKSAGPGPAYLVTAFNYPDGTTLKLDYEPITGGGYTGRITSLTLRTGGVITYQYSGGTNGLDCTYLVPPVLTRTTQDGATTYTWTLVNNGNGNYGNTTTVVDPGKNKTVYTFTGLTGSGPAIFPTMQALTQIQRYQNTGTLGSPVYTLISTDLICYNGAAAGCQTAVVKYPIVEKDVYHTPAGMASSSHEMIEYDSYGNITEDSVFDFGSSTVFKSTAVVYGSWNGSGCVAIGNFINNRPCDVSYTQNSTKIAERRFTYDSHGNLLRTYKWTGSTWLSNSTADAYNVNGTLSTGYDLANNPTTYGYSPTKYVSCAQCTNYPFPTSITAGGLTSYTTWNGVGGVKVSDQDSSGNTTTYCYSAGANCGGAADPFWRVLSNTDPAGNVVSTTYPSSGSPDSGSGVFTFNSGNSIQSIITTTDGYGRNVNEQHEQSPGSGNYDTTSVAYGWSNGYGTVATSQPCTKPLGSSCGTVHTKYYDVLGRLQRAATTNNESITHTYTQNDDLIVLSPPAAGENVKQIQKQYDGLGRLQYSCAIGNGSSTACSQNTGSQNGVTTAVSYSASSGSTTVSFTRGSQTRSKTYDGLGRPVVSVTPEGGTWKYYYDTAASACSGSGASAGNLTCAVDPNGNQIVYFYDSLNRITDVGAGVGGSTACRRFRYDSASNGVQVQPTGSAIANAAGRLVEAETDTCVSSGGHYVVITDEWFSYDQNGRLTDFWEWTPHSGQYYHSIATFFENGLVKTLQLASPAFYAVTYGLDGEGRWNSLTDTTTGQPIVTGATFYPAANPATIDFTGSDSDSYTYDSSTGNMKQFQFNVGGKSEIGVLTWNPNRTLKTLAITDGFNSGGTQTCHFNPSDATNTGYDDLGRLIGVDCGGGQWGQTFSFDQYDNLTKNVILGRIGSTWNPGYSVTPSNNHCNICTYDADGNVTSDGNNNYGWNEFAKLQWTATSGTANCGSSGECITYDAFGRMVENSSGGSYNQIWITQLGTIVQMAGSTIDYGYFPGPMGGTAIINGNSSGYGYVHKDWVGSSRIVSNVAAHGVTVDQAFSPYGEIYDQFGSSNSPYDMFATLTDNFSPGIVWDTPNRELSSVGRWLSPDPAGAGWNQYGYATNPNGSIDPTGLLLLPPQSGPAGWYGGSASQGCSVNGMSTTQCGYSTGPIDPGVNSSGGYVLPSGTVSTIQYDQNHNVVPGSVGVVDTNGTVWLDTSTGTIKALGPPTPPIVKSDAAWDLLTGTFNAPGAALNKTVCGDSASCGLFLALALSMVSDEFEEFPDEFTDPLTGITTGKMTLAGYNLGGAWAMVDDTFTMNISTFVRTNSAGTFQDLSDALVTQAEDSGATSINIKGSLVSDQHLGNADFMTAFANRYGWTYQQVDANTFQITRAIP